MKQARLALLLLAAGTIGCIEFGLRMRDQAQATAAQLSSVQIEASAFNARASQVPPWQSLEKELDAAERSIDARLSRVAGLGQLRAAALESIGEMCTRESLGCNSVSLVSDADSATPLTARSVATPLGPASATAAPSPRLMSGVRVVFANQEGNLERFLKALEREAVYFAVIGFSVRGQRIEVQLRAHALLRTLAAEEGTRNASIRQKPISSQRGSQ